MQIPMLFQMVTMVIVNIVLLALSAIIAIGWGDNLIAGYNTMSPKERNQYHVKRLRIVIALTLLLTTVFLDLPFLLGESENIMAVLASVAYIYGVCFIAIILANTWCKRK